MELFRKVGFALQDTMGPPMSTRLEPQSVSGDPATGLRAEVWDPLWLLARQWQLGELTGEDTGTPLTVRVRATAEPLVAWRPGPSPDADWRPLAPGVSLEELTLAETSPSPSARELALAGWALLETLEDLGESRAATSLHDRFGAPPPAIPVAPQHTALVPDTWAPIGASLARGTLDLAGVLAAFEGQERRPAWWRTALLRGAARRARAEDALAHWLSWIRAEVLPEDTDDGSWVGSRLEHQFAVATPTRVLTAPSHPGGPVSWSAVDLEQQLDRAVPPPSDAPSRTLDRTLVATPLVFPGMPASRFWELEDGRVDLGSVWADPHELGRLLVVECALVHGGDWLVVPVDVPCGCVVTLDEVTYNDTFGTTWVVDTSGADTPRWRMFEVSGSLDPSVGLGGLLVPPAPASPLRGGPVEDVGFLRDESANLVWAVERLVADPGGDPVTPRSAPPVRRTPPTQQGADVVLGYELMTDVPQTWTPYLPRVRVAEDGLDTAVALVRGHVRRYDERGDPADVEPAGTLLRADEHRWVESAEVPREGVRVQRSPVLSRRGDGSWASWIERRVLVGRGEAESGLRSDLTVRPTP